MLRTSKRVRTVNVADYRDNVVLMRSEIRRLDIVAGWYTFLSSREEFKVNYVSVKSSTENTCLYSNAYH